MTAALKIQALIFDFDGLILETEGPIYQSWQRVYQAYGFDLPPEIWANTIGTWDDPFEPHRDLEMRLGARPDWPSIERQRVEHETRLVLAQPIQAGVLAYLQGANRLGLKVGLASSSERDWVAPHLERLGIRTYFQCILTLDDVRRAKPDPELYLAAAACLRVQPRQAIALEDSQHGVAAARSAGLFTVAVPTQMTKGLSFAQADMVINSLADLPLEVLLARAMGG